MSYSKTLAFPHRHSMIFTILLAAAMHQATHPLQSSPLENDMDSITLAAYKTVLSELKNNQDYRVLLDELSLEPTDLCLVAERLENDSIRFTIQEFPDAKGYFLVEPPTYTSIAEQDFTLFLDHFDDPIDDANEAPCLKTPSVIFDNQP